MWNRLLPSIEIHLLQMLRLSDGRSQGNWKTGLLAHYHYYFSTLRRFSCALNRIRRLEITRETKRHSTREIGFFFWRTRWMGGLRCHGNESFLTPFTPPLPLFSSSHWLGVTASRRFWLVHVQVRSATTVIRNVELRRFFSNCARLRVVDVIVQYKGTFLIDEKNAFLITHFVGNCGEWMF